MKAKKKHVLSVKAWNEGFSNTPRAINQNSWRAISHIMHWNPIDHNRALGPLTMTMGVAH